MGLTFLSPLLLAGAALVAIPIVLHLVMRQLPKHVLFPAIRFIQRREQANRRQLRLRHLLLLLLRAGAIVMLAAALARPSIKTEGSLGSQEAPVAAALIFDTSPRMAYRRDNQTRLDVAREAGRWLLTQLPADSEAAVLESEEPAGEFAVDLGAAGQRIGRLKPAATATPLPEAVSNAVAMLKKKEKLRKEIYVFTDLAAGAWPDDKGKLLKAALAEAGDIGLYVIDVGLAEPQDFALADVTVSPEVSAKNGKVRIQTDAIRLGPDADRSVAIYVLDASGNPQPRGQQTIHWHAGERTAIDFALGGEEIGTHQGYVQIMGDDNLATDDVRYFTFDIRPPFRVLVAAPKPADRYSLFLTQAIAPQALRKNGRARFECETVALDQLMDRNLESYAAVCLLDPAPLPPETWQRLGNYVRQGGGLAVWLGRNAQPIDKFDDPLALALLPGKPIDRVHADANGLFLAPTNSDLSHPIMARFRPISKTVPWNNFPVWEYWRLAGVKETKGADVVLPYSDEQPALVERNVGRGRVLLMTTSISDAASDPAAWSQLATGFQPWPFVMLSNEMMLYLAGSGEERLNYTVGDRVVLRLEESQTQSVFSLLLSSAGQPGAAPAAQDAAPLTADQANRTVSVPGTAAPGNYRVRAGGSEGGVDRGFSANIKEEATNLARIQPAALDDMLGAARYRLAHGREEIDRSVSVGRVGRELYPYMICIVALALALEHVLGNRFYRRIDGPPARKAMGDSAAQSPVATSSAAPAASAPPAPPPLAAAP